MNRLLLVVAAAAALFSVAHAAVNYKIVGGKKAENGQFPYVASLMFVEQHFCGCSIINEQWVLTAAHCVDGRTKTSLTIVTGTNTLNKGGTIYHVQEYFVHPDYFHMFNMVFHDIALIKLDRRITLGDKVKLIELNADPVPTNSTVTVIGWGFDSYKGKIASNNLNYLEQKVLSTEECQKRLPIWHIVSDEELCAFTSTEQGAYKGDFGGPLVFKEKVAGVTSRGESGYPNLYTRVSTCINWITNTMKFN